MAEGTDVTGLNYPTEAELSNLVFYAWDRTTPLSQFKVRIEDFSLVSGGGSSGVQEWAPNFTAAGDMYIPANAAMTIAQGNAKIGTGTLAYAKSTNAAPSTFTSTTLPATLEAGAWLKITASAVTGFVATHLVRN